MKNILFNINDSVFKLVNKNKLIVCNYLNIKDISQEKIVLEKYLIEGNGLVVKKMDQYEIEIIGVIESIKTL